MPTTGIKEDLQGFKNLADPKIPELIARLQAAKFPITTSEVLDATRLLAKLAENNASLQADFLRDHLRPLLCKSTERQVQQQFDAIFQQWWDEGRRVELEPSQSPVTPPEQPKPPKRKLRIAVLLFILSLALALLYWQRRPVPELIDVKPTPAIAEQKTDVPKPIKPDPGSNKPQAPAKPESPRIYGYWPAYRYTETLRPALAWLLVGAPLLLLLFFHLPAWALSRRRSGGGAGIMLKGWDRDLAARRLVKPLTDDVASRFDWHIRGPAEEIRRWSRRPSIDVARTVSATLASLGIPRLRYRHARLHPEYLVLVEADHDDDFAMLWAERLKKQGLAVDLRRLIVPKDGSRPSWHNQQTGETGRFDNLPNPGFAQRLIVVSDGSFLLDGQGEWRDWAIAAQLQRWPVRALFSPKEPRDLLAGSLAVLDSAMRPGDPGFLVLPQEESALAAWSTWLASGQMPVIVPAEAQRFPRLIAEQGEQRYLDDAAPDAAEVARLIAELHVYLGENGFYWLCCCAIPPLMRTGLTLLLGEEYLRRAGASGEDKLRYHLARNYRLLIRLPWLRHNQMPDWLRMALRLRLSPPLEEEMRDVVDGLLARQSPDASGSLPLGFDAPQAGAAVGAGGESQSTHHALYLGFMSGLSARQLQLRIPGPWQSWLNRLDSRPHSLRRWRDWLAAGFARLLFRGGLPENGAARFSLLAGWVMTALSVVLLTAVNVLPPKDWPQPWREVLFVEGAELLVFRHQGAVRHLVFKEDMGGKVGFRFPWPMSEARAEGIVSFDPEEQGRQDQLQLEKARIRLQQAKLQNQQATLRLQKTKLRNQQLKLKNQQLELERAQLIRNIELANFQIEQSILLKPIPSNDTKPMLLAVTGDHIIQHWNIQTGALQEQLTDKLQGEAPVSKRESLDSVVSPDGELTLVFDDERTLRLLATEQFKALKETENERESVVDEIESIKLRMENEDVGLNAAGTTSRAGKGPAWAALKTEVTLLNSRLAIIDERIKSFSNQPELAIGEPLRHVHRIVDAIFSPDSRQIATATEDGTVRLWRAQIGVTVSEPMLHEAPINQAAYNLDGSRAVTASGNAARLWDARDGTSLGKPMQHQDNVFQAVFSPDGKQLLTISRDKTVQLWDALNGLSMGKPIRHTESINGAAFSPDGKRLVTASDDNTAQLWDVQSGAALGKPMRHEDDVNFAVFSPDGERVVTASDDKTAPLWDAQTGEPIGEPMVHENKVGYATFSPDGKQIVTMSEGNTVRLWNAQTGQPLGISMRHESNIWDINFSPEGNRVITASSDNTAQQWDAQTGAPVGQPLRHEDAVRQASYSPDGQRIITGSDDGTVRLWDAKTNALLGVLPAPGRVGTAVFHPNKDQVLIARSAKDGEARIWRISPYPAIKPAFEYAQDHLKTIAIFSILLALLLERASHIFSRHRFNQRLHYYAPGSSDKTARHSGSLGVVVRLRSAYEKFVKRMRLHKRTLGKFSAPQ